ncbi:MAG: hypothetical protein IJ409_05765 [Lachnospiraceae bacterium]|nr:hypothetical protein [Lachnospiraceae bacterium]
MKFRTITKKEFVWLIIAVVIMGLCVSFLDKTALGTDPCTMFNLGMADRLGMSFGNWQALFNCILFIFVFFFARNQIGWGTLANMFLVGYSYDFFTWLNSKWIPDEIYTHVSVRILITIPVLAVFILAASLYIAIQQGTAPYDAFPYILHNLINHKSNKLPFKIVRMIWDIGFCIFGLLLGSRIGIVTILIAFALGPVISYLEKNVIRKLLHK